MNKGIVMEITEKHIIVMTQEGRFEKLARKNRQCQIGEEIVFAESRINWKSPSIAGKSALAAAIVFCLVLFGSFAGKLGMPHVVAYVSLDINPSVEMGIDEQETVIELKGLNQDGIDLIQNVDFQGKKLEDVTGKLLDKAEQTALARGEGEIVIASTVVEGNAKIDDEALVQKLKQQVESHIKTTHPDRYNDYEVAAFAAPREIRETAKQNGISMGKYAVYLSAKNNGEPVTVEDFKKESVLQLIKEKSVDKLSSPGLSLNKAVMKQLLEEEKSGQLDKKVEEIKKERDRNNKNDDKKPSNFSNNNGNKNDSKKNDSKNDNNDGKKNDNKNDSRKDNRNDDKMDVRNGNSNTSQPGKPSSRQNNQGNGQSGSKPAPNQRPGNQTGKQQDANKKEEDNNNDRNQRNDDDRNKDDDRKKDDDRNKDEDRNKEDPKKGSPNKDNPRRDDPRKDDSQKSDADRKTGGNKKDDEDIKANEDMKGNEDKKDGKNRN
jgi:hypothetical protein